METSNYGVEFEDFTNRHYIKAFQKKYKTNWDKTQDDIVEVCKRIDSMLLLKRADLIAAVGIHKLIKLDFAVEGTKLSPKASGNRCILYLNESLHLVRVLLIYSKNDISDPGETAKWKKIIKEQYVDIGTVFSL